MKIELAERQPVKVTCIRYTGPCGEPQGRFWRTTVTPWLADHGLLDCPRYGVSLDDPRVTPPEECCYDACIELPAGLALPDAAEKLIAGGRYAITHYKGNRAGIRAAWNGFVDAALAGTGRAVDPQRHAFEHYPRGASYDNRTGVFSCELCLPLTDVEHP